MPVLLLLRIAYRCGYPAARVWWWIRRPRAEGVALLIRVDQDALVVRQSFRSGLGLVGGGRRPTEEPIQAAVRELLEEVAIELPPDLLRPLEVMELKYERRRLTVHLFRAELLCRPLVCPDGAEVTKALWMSASDLRNRDDLHPVLRHCLQDHLF